MSIANSYRCRVIDLLGAGFRGNAHCQPNGDPVGGSLPVARGLAPVRPRSGRETSDEAL